MEHTRPAVLIAEDQIFIALEAERILKEAIDCDVHLCRRDQLAALMSQTQFDLIVLEFTGHLQDDLQFASNVQAAGIELAILSSTEDALHIAAFMPGVAHIEKPFNEIDFKNFVAGFVSRRPRS
jgi:DNA-binding NarL/FixJ family response regulator